MLKKHTLHMFSDSLSRMRDADLSEMSNTRGVGAKLKLNGGPRTRKQTPSVLICKKSTIWKPREPSHYNNQKKKKKIRINLFSLLQKCVKKGIPDPKFPILVVVFFCWQVALILIHSSSAGF